MVKRKSYQPWTQDRMYLMPPSMKEWLKEDHLAWFVLDVVSELEISPIERACHENVAFRVITGNRQPYFTTINEFRRVHRKHFEALFAGC